MNLRRPCIAVLDSAANLPLTVQRYGLSQGILPFADDLTRDVMLSVIAHLLVCGPTSRRDAFLLSQRHPLVDTAVSRPLTEADLRWCMTQTEIVPLDPWLFSLLRKDLCRICGAIDYRYHPRHSEQMPCGQIITGYNGAIVPGNYALAYNRTGGVDLMTIGVNAISGFLQAKASAFEHHVVSATVLISARPEFPPTHFDRSKVAWQEVAAPSARRRWWGATKDCDKSPVCLGSLIEPIEVWLGDDASPVFAAELKIRPTTDIPKSPLAALWAECLGEKAVPFNRTARRELIDHALSHIELRRHIEAWQTMKRAKSKWVNYREGHDRDYS